MGLSALSVTAKVFVGIGFWGRSAFYYRLDHRGRVLDLHQDNGNLESITDLAGRIPEELRGERLDRHALDQVSTFEAGAAWPRTRSYRNRNCAYVKYDTETTPGNEIWWYVIGSQRLAGYDKQLRRPVGTFGPDGFASPGEEANDRFDGQPAHYSKGYSAWTNNYLAFPDAVYKADFRKRRIDRLFVPPAAETVQWASRWSDDK